MSIARLGAAILVAGLAAWASAASGALHVPPETIPAFEGSIALVGKSRATEPGGFARMCMRQPTACQPRPGRLQALAEGRVHLDPWSTHMVLAINSLTNREIRPQAERPGAPDYWKIGGPAGDCEDYALAKRERLIRAGFPSSSLVLATAHLMSGEYHAVLLLRTDQGDYVLDNLAADVLPVPKARLKFQMVQSGDDPRTWLAL